MTIEYGVYYKYAKVLLVGFYPLQNRMFFYGHMDPQKKDDYIIGQWKIKKLK